MITSSGSTPCTGKSENLAGLGFRTASQVSVALVKLEQDGFVDKNEDWKIHDPIFNRWLQPK